VAPLLVIEFLHRVADIFKDYLHELTEAALKENFVSAYEVRPGTCMRVLGVPPFSPLDPCRLSVWTSRTQLLEEMMDNGFPLTTEPSILKELIPPTTMMTRVVNTVSGATGCVRASVSAPAPCLFACRTVRACPSRRSIQGVTCMCFLCASVGVCMRALADVLLLGQVHCQHAAGEHVGDPVAQGRAQVQQQRDLH
jgi:hypothetical protein